jgi:hypothetical protein
MGAVATGITIAREEVFMQRIAHEGHLVRFVGPSGISQLSGPPR